MKLSILAGAAILAIASPVSPQNADLSDAEIAHIAYTAGQIDIDAGKQALAEAEDPAVRDFAQTMVRDHQAVNDQALALVAKLHVTPQPNATSEALTTQAQETARRLATLEGQAYDRAYIANEVEFHRTVTDALSSSLIPSTENPELRSLLQSGLELFREHLAHAEQLAETER